MSTNAAPLDPARADRFVSHVGDYLLRLPAGEIGAQLQALRHTRGLTQDDVAKRMGVKQTVISRLEHSDNPAIKTLLAYLDALDAELVELRIHLPEETRIALPLAGNDDAR
jgi:transcriptional regulator with XRE-family HTH domain